MPQNPVKDELRRESFNYWRYVCSRPECGHYWSIPMTLRGAQLIQRVHRHRHIMGLAGIYHRVH